MKAQKKPVIIDYYPIRQSDTENNQHLKEWVEGLGLKFEDHFEENKVKTLEGTSYEFSIKDVIIKGVKDEFYPCKKDIFEQTYDIL